MVLSSAGLVKKKGGNGSETEVEGCGEGGVCAKQLQRYTACNATVAG